MRLNGWYAVARFADLRNGPVRVSVNGQPLVVWQIGEADAAALIDRCPHRGAPLSEGRVQQGRIACPYHGWQFSGHGKCVEMPGLADEVPDLSVRSFPVRVRCGVVLAAFGTHPTEPEAPSEADGAMSSVVIADSMPASVVEVAENILDTTHTSVVHAGYLRSDRARTIVQPEVELGSDWIAARYPPEASPSGFVSRMIGLGPYQITDRFRAPAIAEVEYRLRGRLEFRSRFWLTPKSEDETHVFAELAVGGSGLIARLKLFALRRMMARIVAQDRDILGKVSANTDRHGFSRLVAPQDVMRAGIEAILRGEPPQAPARLPRLRV